MISKFTIANKYATALFNIAKQDNLVKEFLDDLAQFSNNFSDQFISALSNPAIAKRELAGVINDLAKKLNITNQKIIRFVTLLLYSRKIKLFNMIYQDFLKLSKINQKILSIEIFVIDYLTNEQLAQIKILLQKKYPNNIIEINQIIKKNILGGLIIKINSIVIDATISNQLNKIATELKSNFY